MDTSLILSCNSWLVVWSEAPRAFHVVVPWKLLGRSALWVCLAIDARHSLRLMCWPVVASAPVLKSAAAALALVLKSTAAVLVPVLKSAPVAAATAAVVATVVATVVAAVTAVVVAMAVAAVAAVVAAMVAMAAVVVVAAAVVVVATVVVATGRLTPLPAEPRAMAVQPAALLQPAVRVQTVPKRARVMHLLMAALLRGPPNALRAT